MKTRTPEYSTALLSAAKQAAELFGYSVASLSPLSNTTAKVNASNNHKRKIELFLKAYPDEPSKNILLHDQLKSNGFDLMVNYHQTKNRDYFVKVDNKIWICQTFYPNLISYDWLNFDCGIEHCMRAGQTLSELHFAGRRVLSDQPELKLPNTNDVLEQFLNGLDSKIKIFLAGNSNNFSAKLSPGSKEILQQLLTGSARSKFSERTEIVMDLEKKCIPTINHGDFHPGNLLFSSKAVFAVIDWDYACLGSPLYDLSMALFMFCLKPSADAKELFDGRKTGAFLEAYSRASSVVKNIHRLAAYSNFSPLLTLDWVLDQTIDSNSGYLEHPGFDKLVQTLAYCCQ